MTQSKSYGWILKLESEIISKRVAYNVVLKDVEV